MHAGERAYTLQLCAPCSTSFLHLAFQRENVIRFGRGCVQPARSPCATIVDPGSRWIGARLAFETFSQPLFPCRTGCESGRPEPGFTRRSLVEIRLKAVERITRRYYRRKWPIVEKPRDLLAKRSKLHCARYTLRLLIRESSFSFTKRAIFRAVRSTWFTLDSFSTLYSRFFIHEENPVRQAFVER